MGEKILPEFQDFLISRALIPEKNIRYYAYWVSRFLAFSNNNEDMMLEQRILHFLAKLRKDITIAEWQVQQAETAINVYLKNYLDGDVSIFCQGKKEESYAGNEDSHTVKEKEKDTFNLQLEYKDAVYKMREMLRLRHYAYRTERTYLDWVKQFYIYLENTRKKTESSLLNGNEVKNFLSYLALNRKVSASTQNQAFFYFIMS
jgi:hypothetical protein